MIHRSSTACMVLWLAACASTAFAAGASAPAASAASAPAASATAASAPASPHAFGKKRPAATAPARPLVDINSASVKQLKTLPGIGDAEAQRIVAGRPYRSKADLVTQKVLPAGIYLSLRRLIVAKPSGKPDGKV